MSETLDPHMLRRDIPFDTTRFGLFTELYEDHYEAYLFNPLHDTTATDKLASKVETWKTTEVSPVTVVLTAGVYDLLHLDHTGYLLHTKSAGASYHYDKHYGFEDGAWDELEPREQESLIQDFLANGELKLVVSVDGDTSVSVSKGGKPEKGNGTRPIFSWETRARTVANVNAPLSTSDGGHVVRPVADAVTIHGPHEFDEDSPHYDMVKLAARLQPNVWAIYGEALDTLEAASTCSAIGSVALKCIPLLEGRTYFEDRLLGGRFSTTKIVNRAKGEL